MKQTQTKKVSLTTRATDVINALKFSFLNSPQCFDFHCAQYLSGANNTMLRQEIARQLTGETLPATRCGIYAIADVMKNSFSQYQLFTV